MSCAIVIGAPHPRGRAMPRWLPPEPAGFFVALNTEGGLLPLPQRPGPYESLEVDLNGGAHVYHLLPLDGLEANLLWMVGQQISTYAVFNGHWSIEEQAPV